jgi:diaminopimelate decarboxylase
MPDIIPLPQRRPYAPPVVRRHRGNRAEAPLRNPLALGTRTQTCEHIDGVPVAELCARFGSPLFAYSERTVRSTMRRARDAFQSRYPDTQFAWSYKTCYLSSICALFHGEGSIAEVVSGFEYEKARRLGVPGSDIVFNGPHKTDGQLERAIVEGARIQVDNWDELLRIESLARENGWRVPVAPRVWMDTGIVPAWSKFGFGFDNGDAWRAIERIHDSGGHLALRGLHTHIGTYILEPEAYRIATTRLVDLARRAREQWGTRVEYLNLGGGFASRSTLHYAAEPGERTVPPIEAYAEAITGVLNRLPPAERPQLLLETGRALIDEAGYLIASVVAVKPAAPAPATDLSGYAAKQAAICGGGQDKLLIIDAGVNLLYTATWFRFDVKPARASTGAPPSNVRLCGNLCMNIDIVREQVALPPLDRGDHVVIHPVGAYNLTQSMQFIAYRPAVVLIGMDGAVDVIRKRETLDDVERPERLPQRLGDWQSSTRRQGTR